MNRPFSFLRRRTYNIRYFMIYAFRPLSNPITQKKKLSSTNNTFLFNLFTGSKCHCCVHHKSFAVRFTVLLFQFAIGGKHLLESKMVAQRLCVWIISINAVRFIGCVIIYRFGYYNKSLCNDRTSKDLSQVINFIREQHVSSLLVHANCAAKFISTKDCQAISHWL